MQANSYFQNSNVIKSLDEITFDNHDLAGYPLIAKVGGYVKANGILRKTPRGAKRYSLALRAYMKTQRTTNSEFSATGLKSNWTFIRLQGIAKWVPHSQISVLGDDEWDEAISLAKLKIELWKYQIEFGIPTYL